MEVAPMDGGIESIYFSKKVQWLSTDFTISSEGRVKFESYINNVHPIEHKVMYPVLEEILELFIPMFEDVLMDMRAYPTKDKRFSVDFRDWYGDEVYWNFIGNRDPLSIKVPEFFSAIRT